MTSEPMEPPMNSKLNAAITTINGRYTKLIALEVEARYLARRFGLPLPACADLKSTLRVPTPDLAVGRDREAELRLFDPSDHGRIVRVAEREHARDD